MWPGALHAPCDTVCPAQWEVCLPSLKQNPDEFSCEETFWKAVPIKVEELKINSLRCQLCHVPWQSAGTYTCTTCAMPSRSCPHIPAAPFSGAQCSPWPPWPLLQHRFRLCSPTLCLQSPGPKFLILTTFPSFWKKLYYSRERDLKEVLNGKVLILWRYLWTCPSFKVVLAFILFFSPKRNLFTKQSLPLVRNVGEHKRSYGHLGRK